ncbi:hypothetical protein FRC06_005091 [Ceratobasidium sp. 370]|nr:hypothetical protein FRC06_005091 [Ceratobasidium sp. 370]
MGVSVSTYHEGSRGREKKGKRQVKKQAKQAGLLPTSVTVYDEPVYETPELDAHPQLDPGALNTDHQDWTDEGVEEMEQASRRKKSPNQYLNDWLKNHSAAESQPANITDVTLASRHNLDARLVLLLLTNMHRLIISRNGTGNTGLNLRSLT